MLEVGKLKFNPLLPAPMYPTVPVLVRLVFRTVRPEDDWRAAPARRVFQCPAAADEDILYTT